MEEGLLTNDASGAPTPRLIGRMYRLTFPAGNQVLRLPGDHDDDEWASASEVEVLDDARWTLLNTRGWWVLRGTNERGARVVLDLIEGAPHPEEVGDETKPVV